MKCMTRDLLALSGSSLRQQKPLQFQASDSFVCGGNYETTRYSYLGAAWKTFTTKSTNDI